jgi:hypothetical protein
MQQVRATMQKYNNQLIEVPAISLNLLNIVKVLREEEKDEIRPMVDGNQSMLESNMQCMEYFVNARILETLASYALTDEPRGFFKFMLGVIEDLIQSVNRKKTSFLSFTSIHCSIQHMLKTIYFKLLEIPYEFGSNQMIRPSPSFVENQRPCIVNYTIDVLKFLNTITFKI